MKCSLTFCAVVSLFTVGSSFSGLGAFEPIDVPRYALDNGDTNGDIERNLSDGIYILNHIFVSGPTPVPLALCVGQDTTMENGDGNLNISDPIGLLNWLFGSGSAPKAACEESAENDGSAARHGFRRARVIPPIFFLRRIYSLLATKWWQWALSIPATGHPLADETGEDCDVAQRGPVFFLGGAFAIVDPNNEFAFIAAANRVCRVPKGKFIFFPILNTLCSTAEPNFPSCTATDAELLDCARDFAPDPTTPSAIVEAEADGRSIRHLDRFLFFSQPFNFTVDEADPLQPVATEEVGADGETVACPVPRDLRCADSGVYVLLAPLSRGMHDLHFFGRIVFSEDPLSFFELDITYKLIVE